MTTPPEPTRRRFLFEGLDRGFRNGDRAVLRKLDDAGRPTGGALAFQWKAKSFAGMTPGWTYSLKAEEREGGGLSIILGSATDAAPLADEAERQAIRLRHDAAMTSLRADKVAEKVAASDKDLVALLAPIQRHYRQMTTTQQKVAFEVALIAALRKGGIS